MWLLPVQPHRASRSQILTQSYIAPFFKIAQNMDLRCVLISDPSTLGAKAKPRLHTPKACDLS